MPFKDMMLDDADILHTMAPAEEASLLKIILSNNSPVLAVWFVIMGLNVLALALLF